MYVSVWKTKVQSRRGYHEPHADDESSSSEYGSSVDNRPDLLPDLKSGGISGKSRSSSFSGSSGEAEDVRLCKGEVWWDGGVDWRAGEKIAGRKYMTPRDERARRKLGEWDSGELVK